MPDLTDVEIGKMLQAVDQLSKEVDRLTIRLDQLESQLDKGKGVLLGAVSYTHLTLPTNREE